MELAAKQVKYMPGMTKTKLIYTIKISKLRIRHSKRTHGHLMARNDQQPTSTNSE